MQHQHMHGGHTNQGCMVLSPIEPPTLVVQTAAVQEAGQLLAAAPRVVNQL